MPFYDLECQKCGHRFEVMVHGFKLSAKCEKCRSKKVKKVITSCYVSGTTSGNGGACSGCSGRS